MTNVLVTGGAGYVGSVLVPKLLQRGYSVTVLDLMIYGNPFEFLKDTQYGSRLNVVRGDIRDYELVDLLMDGIGCVIHLACISNDPSFDLNPELGESINLDAFEPLVDIAKENEVKRFINASSSSVYGIKKEKNVTEDMSLNPLSDYSRFKKETEVILKSYSSKDFTTVSVRSATVCGFSRRQRLDVIVNILTNFAYHKREMVVHGGPQKRPNIHIEDITDLYCDLILVNKTHINGDVFNYGADNYTINELALMVKDCVGEDVIIKHEETDDLRSYHISSDKINKKLGFVPRRTIKEAIYDLVYKFKTEPKIDTFTNEKYYNIMTMKKLRLE